MGCVCAAKKPESFVCDPDDDVRLYKLQISSAIVQWEGPWHICGFNEPNNNVD